MDQFEVNGLSLPALLVDLLQRGRWRHPGDEVLVRLVPFLREPVNFLTSVESMRRESSGLLRLAEEPRLGEVFHLARSSNSPAPICLPWLDVELAVLIAVSRLPGDDLGIGLDYRSKPSDPQVVASDWHQGTGGCFWQKIAPSFSQFVRLLGI
jgi:hypothetical protein